MPTISQLQVPPPKSWEDFERFASDLWREVWNDPDAQRNGRQGQSQNGVDVFGKLPNGAWAGVQCKGKDNYSDKVVTEAELKKEVEKAKSFTPKLAKFTLATTGTRDAKIQAVARTLSDSNVAAGLFEVNVWSWEDIVERLDSHPKVVAIHFPDLSATNAIRSKLDNIQSTQHDILNSNAATVAATKDQTETLKESITGAIAQINHSLVANALAAYHTNALDLGRDYLRSNRPAQALAYLLQQKELIWPTATTAIKARLLSGIGGAKIGLGDDVDGAKLLIEAWQLNPAEGALKANAAAAYMILDNRAEAERLAKSVIADDPSNTHAIAVVVQASSDTLESIIATIPESCKTSDDVGYAVGTVAWRQGNLKLAEEWYRNAAKTTEAHGDIKAALAQTLLQTFHASPFSSVPATQRGRVYRSTLTEIETLYGEALDSMPETEARRSRVAWVINRGLVRRLLERQVDARQDFELALQLVPGHPVATYFCALLTDDGGDAKGALKLAETITALDEIPHLPLFVAELKGQVLGPAAAAEYLKTQLAGLTPELLLTAKSMLVKAYVESDNVADAVATCDECLKANPNDVRFLLLLSKIKRSQGTVEDSEALLARAEQCVTPATPARDRLQLAEELHSREKWERAAVAFEQVIDASIDGPLTHKLLNASYRAGRLARALEICAAIKEANGPLLYSTEIESAIFEETGNLSASERTCLDFLALTPDSPIISVRLAVVHLRQRNWQELDRFLNHLPDWKGLPLNAAIQIANLFMVRERYRESTELLYEIRRRFPGEGKIHLRYIQSILFKGSSEHDWLNIENITADCAVCVENGPNERQWFILESGDGQRIELGELDPSHRLWNELLGKKLGDTVQLSAGGITPTVGTIVEVRNKYVHAFHQCGQQIELLHPEVQGFQSVDLKDDPKSFEKILEQIGRQSEGHRNALKIYAGHQLPVGSLAHLLQIDLFDAWTGIVNHRDTPLHCCNGSLPERIGAFALLSSLSDRRVIIDPVALLTIDAMQVKDAVVKVCGRLGVAQATVDLFSETLHRRKSTNQDGFVTLGKEGEQFVKQQVTAEDIERNCKWLEAMLDWIANNCDVLSWSPSLSTSRIKLKELSDFVGAASMDSVLVASSDNRVLYSDDQWLRALAKGEFNTDGFWTQALLMTAVDKSVLDRTRYHRAVIGLVSAQYRQTAIDAHILMEAARIADWRPIRPFDQVVECLKEPQCSKESAVVVTANFICALWDAIVLPDATKHLVFKVLDVIFTGREYRPMMEDLLATLRNRLWLNPIAEQHVFRLLKTWAAFKVVDG